MDGLHAIWVGLGLAILGFGLGVWGLRRSRPTVSSTPLDLGRLQGQYQQLESDHATLTQREAALRNDYANLLQDKARLETESKALLLQLQELKAWQTRQEQQVLAQFEALSQKTLKSVQEELTRKHEKLQSDHQERFHTNLQQILKPLTDQLKHNDDKLKEFGEKTLAQTTSLKTQIDLAYQQTQALIQTKNTLVEALRDSKGRGDWGELELIRLLEDSGLQKGIHYEFQPRQDNASRPDVKIKLPNNNILYIDAKTLLMNLEKVQAAQNESEEREYRKRLTEDLRRQVLKLHSKDYQAEGATVDFVVLYVPRESMLRIPLEEDPTLIQEASKNGVILASPLILMAVLKTVAQGWHQSQLAHYARDMERMGKELHRRAATFLERFEKVGRKIQELSNQFEDTRTAFQGQQGFLMQLDKFEQYGCKSAKALPAAYQGAFSEADVSELVTDPVSTEDPENFLLLGETSGR